MSTDMKYRIIEITKEDGSKSYRCERTGFFRKNRWRTMYIIDGYGNKFKAIFPTLKQAQEFLHIHPAQKVKSEKAILET